MRPIQTDDANTNLTLEGALPLPAQKCLFRDHDGTETPGFETTWLPDEDERERVGAGAPILLRVWGDRHPPVQLVIPEIPAHRKAIDRDHATRAIGHLLAALQSRLADVGSKAESQYPPDALPEPVDFLALWESSLDLTAQKDELDEAIESTLQRAVDETSPADPDDANAETDASTRAAETDRDASHPDPDDANGGRDA